MFKLKACQNQHNPTTSENCYVSEMTLFSFFNNDCSEKAKFGGDTRSCYVRDITHTVPCREQKVTTSSYNHRSHLIKSKIDLHTTHGKSTDGSWGCRLRIKKSAISWAPS